MYASRNGHVCVVKVGYHVESFILNDIINVLALSVLEITGGALLLFASSCSAIS